MTGAVGTPGYMAPEVCAPDAAQRGFTYKADIFSLGLVVLEILAGLKRPYFNVASAREEFRLIMDMDHVPVEKFIEDEDARDFLGKVRDVSCRSPGVC